MGCKGSKGLLWPYKGRSKTVEAGKTVRAERDELELEVVGDEQSRQPEAESPSSVIVWPEDHTKVDSVPHQGKKVDVKVVDVYDGDTCTILVPFGGKFQKLKLREKGVDAPEIRARRDKSKDSELSAIEIAELDELVKMEKRAAISVRNHISEMILGRVLTVQLDERWDKYGGRVLGSLYLPKGIAERTLGSYLLGNRLGKEYNGGKKVGWTREELEFILS